MATFDAKYADGYLALFQGSCGFLRNQIELAEDEINALEDHVTALNDRIAELEEALEERTGELRDAKETA